MENVQGFTWKFHRIGGIDQAMLRTTDELRRLRELDPKLWAALSCPASGLEFDARALALIDTDHDGRIRIPEVVAAVEWLCACLRDPESMVNPGDLFPLSAINTDTEEGRRLEAACRAVLESLGKAGAEGLSREDVGLATTNATQQLFNGDGIVPPHASLDADVRQFISDALAVVGGVADADGQAGIDARLAEAFRAALEAWLSWRGEVRASFGLLGEAVPEAWDLLSRIRAKTDDYFLRCELAAFAPQSAAALNADDKLGVPHEPCGRGGLLIVEDLAELPLARIEADRPLPLGQGLNPAWREPVERFFKLVQPVLERPDSLSREAWFRVLGAFVPYEKALALRPAVGSPDVTFPPADAAGALQALGEEKARELLRGGMFERFLKLAERDAAAPAASSDIAAVERLVVYYGHVHRLLMNFVSFYDFYSLRRNAAFQAGTLFLDGRSCRLCLPVRDVAKHAALASFSELCLIYCQCRRIGAQASEPEAVMNIVAAMTAGDSDLLLEGRNGVFVDNTGQDWDATVVKIVSNPISLRQALWDPYKRFGRMVTEQISKLASARQASTMTMAGQKVESAGAVAAAPPAAPAAPAPAFDIGKSVGIFAAVGLALGALGTALASIANALLALSWWQFPLVILGLFVLISGPSFILAWLKLRKRTLGPLLEASGWAVNSRIAVNYSLGKALTSTAVLPANATRSFRDPLRGPSRWPLFAALAAALLAAAATWLWFNPPRSFLPARSSEPSVQQPAGPQPPAPRVGG